MPRRRFRYDRETQQMVEVFSDSYVPAVRQDYVLWGDSAYKDMKATDGTDISTRTKHRQYMKEKGLTTIDDYGDHFKKEAQKRAEYMATGKGGATRAEDVARAIAEVESRNRR